MPYNMPNKESGLIQISKEKECLESIKMKLGMKFHNVLHDNF